MIRALKFRLWGDEPLVDMAALIGRISSNSDHAIGRAAERPGKRWDQSLVK